MADQVTYKLMKSGEEKQVTDLVISVFDEFISPEYSKEGIEIFKRYANPEALAERSKSHFFTLIAKIDENPIGIIEVKNYYHVLMFFVKKSYQKKGIGRELLRMAIDACLCIYSETGKITVNASPNSVTAYEKMGFITKKDEQILNGVRFTPMVMTLKK